jgi:hypothetical protein
VEIVASDREEGTAADREELGEAVALPRRRYAAVGAG